MRYIKIVFLAIIFFTGCQKIFAQKCDCDLYYRWLKKTIEENDAGFTYTISVKGQQSYNIHNQTTLEKVAKAGDLPVCTAVLKEWLSYFRKFHIGIYSSSSSGDNAVSPRVAIPAKAEAELARRVQAVSKNVSSQFEGIYQTGSYKILVIREEKSFKGYILSSDNPEWKKGETKFLLRQDLSGGVYLMGDHTAKKLSNIKLLDNKYLMLDDIMLNKSLPFVQLDASKELYYKIKFSNNAFIVKINPETIYIKLPSFSSDQRQVIDSLASHWRKEITKSRNLIIDIRNNGGGSDKTYKAILPFIYTNPINRNQIEFYSSALNNKVWFELLKNPGLSKTEQALFLDFTDRLDRNIGGFERIYKDDVSVIKLDSVYKSPQNISVIINENTASAAEQFILDAEQSWKTKTFGHQTAGALDISNVATVNTPDNKLTLVYSTSRYITVGKLTIDDVGILPDFYIDDKVGDENWIGYILERMR